LRVLVVTLRPTAGTKTAGMRTDYRTQRLRSQLFPENGR
jgi:hypothetical protein